MDYNFVITHWPLHDSCFVKSCHPTVPRTGYLSFGIYCILVSCGSTGWITALTFMAVWFTDTDRPEPSGETESSARECFPGCVFVCAGWIWFTGGWWWRRAVALRQRPARTAPSAASFISSPRRTTTVWASTSEEAKSSDWGFMSLSMSLVWRSNTLSWSFLFNT